LQAQPRQLWLDPRQRPACWQEPRQQARNQDHYAQPSQAFPQVFQTSIPELSMAGHERPFSMNGLERVIVEGWD
jgi:hypothetical protein